MKKFSVFALGLSLVAMCANAAVPSTRGRATTASSDSAASTSISTRGRAPVANSSSASTTAAAPTTAARAAVRTTSARSGTTPVSAPVVSARAGVVQKVVQSGTNISAAAANTVVDPICRERYFGCMDSFCMGTNDNGGRCQCSDRKSELDTILADIEKLDTQSYKLATEGVEKVELGSKADYVFKTASDAQKQTEQNATGRKRGASLDLSMWNDLDVASEDIFNTSETDPYNIADKKGTQLYTAVGNICLSKMSGCEKDLKMLQTLYQSNITSDCNAYSNELKKRQTASAQKLAAAEKAIRDAALESFENANKYDLGQCTVEFKKCMTTTAGCKDDFTGCVGIAASQNATNRVGQKSNVKTVDIKGATTKISVASSTMDALLSKKPLCESVTNSCIAVKSAVWDTFLREIAPTIKTAELLAESDLRTNCISNISSCFQKACKDNMDPNDPDGSYDMCLSRPETMRSLCKVQIDPCEAAEPKIMDFVNARLASIRVDACTTEVKECLQSEERCGKDYTQCIGLDRDAIRSMCPQEKLVGCQENGVFSWDKVDQIVQGIYLGIDNNALDQCRKIVSDKMNEICGDTASCAAFDADEAIGTESLISYKNNNGDYVIDGLVSFGNISIRPIEGSTSAVQYELKIAEYINDAKKNNTGGSNETISRINGTLNTTKNKIDNRIVALASDTKVKWCVEGRDMGQISGRQEKTAQRFPHLLDSYITTIMNSGLDKAASNYSKKFNGLVAKANEGQSDEVNMAMCAAMAMNSKQPICSKYADESSEGFSTTNPVCIQYESGPADIFASSEPGLESQYGTTYVISGAKMSQLVKVASNGKSDFIQTDANGNMIASITIVSTYSAETNTCNIITTTAGCKTLDSIITTDKLDVSSSSSAKSIVGGGKSSDSVTVSKQKYQGSICSEMMEPTTVQNNVQM